MQLRIATYNIHRAIGTDRRFRPSRIEHVLRSLDADVVLLQEVDDGVPRSQNLDLARELAAALDYPHFAVGHNVSLAKGRYGNATLSRFPILRERNIDLTIEDRKRRGCQHTSLEMSRPGSDVHNLEVFNLHLGLSILERQRQAGMLYRSRELRGLDEGTPCVVGGDFNDWSSLLRAFFVEALAFESATDRVHRGRIRPIPTYPAFSPSGALDRIYYRGSIRLLATQTTRATGVRMASDHLPVAADFEVS